MFVPAVLGASRAPAPGPDPRPRRPDEVPKNFPPAPHLTAVTGPFRMRSSHRFGPKPAKTPFLVGCLPRLPFRPATAPIQSLHIRAYRKMGVRTWV